MNLPKCIEKIIDNKNKKIESSYTDYIDNHIDDYIDDYGYLDSDNHQDNFI